MLNQIRRQARNVVERWGIQRGGLRLYVHYQPSYCVLLQFLATELILVIDHFHVHVVQVNYTGFSGTSVGQAHLLDDIISLLEIHGEQKPEIFERLTLSYTLGQFHGLYDSMTNAMEAQE
jgi:m7GpppX diphosphatase